jgi:ribonuclease Z
MSGRTQPLEVILPAVLHDWVRQGLVASDTFLPFELRLLPVEELIAWRSETLQVTTVQLSHRVPSVGFVFTEINPEPRLDIQRLDAEGIPRGPLWGELAKGLTVTFNGQLLNGNDYLRPSRPPQRVIVCGDNDKPELLAAVARGADVLVHEATFTQAVVERTGGTFGHSTAAEVARFAEAAGVRNLVLTHFSARYQNDPRRSPHIDNVRDEALAHYSGQLTLAQDLQRYHLGRNGRLEASA